MAKKIVSVKGIYPPVIGFSEQEYSSCSSLKGEKWKTVPLFDGEYEASNYGRLRSKERTLTYMYNNTLVKRTIKQTLLRCVRTTDGYLRVVLKNKASVFLHRIVALTWIGDSELQIDHKNGNRMDNRVCNIEYVTALENVHRAVERGTLDYHAVGLNNTKNLRGIILPLLSKEQVEEIRKLYSPHKFTIRMLTEKYNCCEKVIRDAIKGRNAYKNY